VGLEKIDFYSRISPTKLILGNNPKLTHLELSDNPIISLDFSNCPNLINISLSCCRLTSVDFLKTLPHPEKLRKLKITGNLIKDSLELFSRFVNLETLQIGNAGGDVGNSFYGSLELIKNLTKLTYLCIEGTDVDEGLEYVPSGLAERTKNKPKVQNFIFDCTAGKGKVKAIQEQLRPFNYDIVA